VQSCTNGVMTSSATCSSSGTCGSTGTTSCEPYGCNGTTCWTKCWENTDCFSTAYACYRFDQFLAGMCGVRAKLTSFTSTPSSPRVGTAITMNATGDAGGRTVLYQFTYSTGGGTYFGCSYSAQPSCSFTPTASGAYRLRVEAKGSGSTYTSDDVRELDVTVAP
jgi:hypothetical protein